MIYPHITKLYMYKPPNAYTLDILINNRLWAAKPERFNDPFDCDLEIAKGVTAEDVLAGMRERGDGEQAIEKYKARYIDADGELILEKQKQVDKVIQNFIEENRNFGVVCLSEVCDSILMWSHYAQSHMGICFEFIRARNNPLGDEEICSPVKYERNYPKIDLGQMLPTPDGQTMKFMMWTKSCEWSYEKEWRLITDRGDFVCPLPEKISRVILGIRIEDVFKSSIETLCKARDIQCVQARKADRAFRIEL